MNRLETSIIKILERRHGFVIIVSACAVFGGVFGVILTYVLRTLGVEL